MIGNAEKGLPSLRPSRTRTNIITALILLWSISTLTVGCSLVSIGTYLYFNQSLLYPYLYLVKELAFDVRLVVAALGSLVALFSVIGTVGVCSKKKYVLQVYCYVVILSLISLCGMVIFIFFNKNRIKEVLLYQCMNRLESPSQEYTELYETVQARSRCCGCVEPTDYAKLNLGNLPASCYTEGNLHDMGCLTFLYQVASDSSTVVITGVVTTIALLLLALVLVSWFIVRTDTGKDPWARRITPTGILQQNWVGNGNSTAEKGDSINKNSTGRSSLNSLGNAVRSRLNSGASNSSLHRVSVSAVKKIEVKTNAIHRSGYNNNSPPQFTRRVANVATPTLDF